MRLSHFFIERPVFAAVIAIVILLVGAIAFPSLPVGQYPNIAPPSVTISAQYPGASAETVANTVADPIEEAVNGVENLLYMSSQSTGDGKLQITCTFALGTDPNVDQVLVTNRVQNATPLLPQQVQATGLTVRKASPDVLLAVHMFSPDGSRDQQYIANYIGLHVKNELLRIHGVGDIFQRAARDFAMRIWIDPDRAAARGLTGDDIVAALRAHNTQVAAGAIGQPPQQPGASAYQLNIDARGRLETPEDFGNIIVKTDPTGRVTRVVDVARVELGAADYTTDAFLNEKHATAMGILQLPGANAVQAADEIRTTMDRLKKDFPPGLDYQIIYNPTDYVKSSITEVYKSLFEAVGLVVLVIIVFLQSWRAAVIPILAIPVSLVGTFAVMGAFGFSLNNLTLFGLVLSIGIVVDDAIVVVENIERHLRDGMTPRQAAHMTMDEVGGALIAIALVLCAVFVPSAFITGLSGQFYRQFALTIASATVISLTLSLSLSPAVAAMIMRAPQHIHGGPLPQWRRRPVERFGIVFNNAFGRLSGRYSLLIRRVVRMLAVMLVLYAGLVALTGWRLAATPTGFIPEQDQSSLIIAGTLPPGASLARSDVVAQQMVREFLQEPGVIAGSVYAGVDPTTSVTATNGIQIYLALRPIDWRRAHGIRYRDLIANLQKRGSRITGADVRVIAQPPVRGIGNTGGFKMIVENRSGASYEQLEAAANALAAAASRDPAIGRAFVTFNIRTPRIFADIDRTKAEMLGVPDSAIFDTLQVYLGSVFVNDFNMFDRTFQVYAQADERFRQNEAQIGQLQTRSNSGVMVPLASVVNVRHTTGPWRVLRYNLFPSAEVQGDARAGHSSGQALAAMERLAQRVLPAGFGYEWTELSYQEKAAGDTGMLVFGLAVVFVYLVLAALYESVTLPASVILIVPMCILAAMIGLAIRHQPNSILTQVGLIVLVGLAAKNAILIVEFARQGEFEKGLPRPEAAEAAGRTRLRPILMTSFAFIFGVAPLAFAAGSGAELRQALGVAVFFGMIGVTFFGLIFTPAFYVVFRNLADRLPKPHRDAPSPAASPAE
ncbi:MAG TPA: multidrug efflux RND transporter permease subunit [Caulobacteraceae bacterium]|jgi:HAE1 family hydrophobic/amphiphilic exporter-1|nr:multidrug efflux RND transporter permease subunit [Caulobacteraceae bacterium]